MQFFKALAELATEKIQFQIGITIEDGAAAVTVVPKTTKAWPPFVMRGTPDELDAEFEKGIESLKAAVGVIGNAADYVEQVKAAAAETKKPATVTKPAAAKPAAKPPANDLLNPKPEEPKEEAEEPAKVEPPKPAAKVEAKKPEPKKAPVPEVSDEDDSLALFE